MERADSSIRPSGSPSGRHQRRLKNYLLDRHFQLKYAGYLAGVALLIGTASGVLLWSVSEETIEQSQASVELGEEVLSESKKVSEVVAMNIVKDPVYSDNPSLKAAFEADAKRQAEKLQQQQQGLEAQAQRLEQVRMRVLYILIGVLVLLVAGLWLTGIVVTHKVAGPVFKMKRLMRALERGDFEVPSPLRKGDELKEFFDAFNDMVRSLRTRRQGEVEALADAINELRNAASPDQLKPLEDLKARLEATLEGPSS